MGIWEAFLNWLRRYISLSFSRCLWILLLAWWWLWWSDIRVFFFLVCFKSIGIGSVRRTNFFDPDFICCVCVFRVMDGWWWWGGHWQPVFQAGNGALTHRSAERWQDFTRQCHHGLPFCHLSLSICMSVCMDVSQSVSLAIFLILWSCILLHFSTIEGCSGGSWSSFISRNTLANICQCFGIVTCEIQMCSSSPFQHVKGLSWKFLQFGTAAPNPSS